MRIKTQFILTMLLFGIILVVIALSAIITSQRVEKAGNQERIAAGIAQGASELSYLANDYLIYRESRQLNRWQSRFTSFSGQVAGLNVERSEQQALVRNIQANQHRVKEVFDSTVSALENRSANQIVALDPALLQVSWSRMAVQSQGLISDASRLSLLLHQEIDRLRETRTRLIYVMVFCFGALLLAGYMLTYRRILKSIATLQAGAKVIGSGNLDFRIEEKRKDEIGDLSHAFNRMTSDLKAVTASKADLEREVAERKLAEQQLRKSEQRWATTLASIGDAVIATDVEGRVTFLNAVAESLTGWTFREASEKPVREVFHIINEHTREEADNPVAKVLMEGNIVGLANHTVLIRKDGAEVAIDDSGAPIKDPSGRLLGVILVFRDITERRKAEQALRRSAQFPEENPNPVLRISAGGALLYANTAARSWLATFGGQADGSLPAPVREVAAQTLGQDRVFTTELGNPAGSTFWVSALQPPGEEYINLYCIDITERKRAEEALRESEHKYSIVADFTYDWEYWRGPDNRFVYVSPSCETVTGHKREEFLQDPDLYARLIHPDDRERVVRHMSEDLNSGERCEMEFLIVRRDGQERWMAHVCQPVLDAKGEFIGRRASNRDITERKRSEEALQTAHAQLQEHARKLQETNKELEGFAYTISHDLRAPLRAINGFARMLHDDYGPSLEEEAKRRLCVIETNAIKMGLLIDDLLAFSRAGRTAMSTSRIDMNSLVAEVMGALKISHAGDGAEIRVAALPAAQGDPSLIRQVLANLLENAMKFSRNRPDPRIEVGSFEREGEHVYFVRDNGVGFDMKYHDKLFGVFQRLVTDREFEGTGVGLAIVHRLVTRHGGRVWAESRPGEGATFFFTLNRTVGSCKEKRENNDDLKL